MWRIDGRKNICPAVTVIIRFRGIVFTGKKGNNKKLMIVAS